MISLAVVAAGCGSSSSSPTSPTSNVPYSQTDLRIGTGTEAVSGKRCSVGYTGWLYDPAQPEQKGQQFETTGGGSINFTLGAGKVIAGWDQGIVGMRVGGVRRLVIPPSLAYGSLGNGVIPPDAAIIFEVELLDVQ
jgi:FKBP-type peptidyl-prolyl cis-trans isomerase FkpA